MSIYDDPIQDEVRAELRQEAADEVVWGALDGLLAGYQAAHAGSLRGFWATALNWHARKTEEGR